MLERGNLLLKRSFVTIFSSYQCQHFTNAQVLMLPLLAFSLYRMWKVVPLFLPPLLQSSALENYESSNGCMQANCSWASICCQALAPGDTFSEKRPDAALIERSPEMRPRQHQQFSKLKEENNGRNERSCVPRHHCRTSNRVLFSSSSVQRDTGVVGWGGMCVVLLI